MSEPLKYDLWLPGHDLPAAQPRSDELYSGIIRVDQIANLRIPHNKPGVAMSIEDDTTLNLSERIITLKGHRLFVFNALLLNFGRQITRKDIEELGFAPGNSAGTRPKTFSLAKSSLRQELVYGQPLRSFLLQKYDSKKIGRYQLDPNIEYSIVDRRAES